MGNLLGSPSQSVQDLYARYACDVFEKNDAHRDLIRGGAEGYAVGGLDDLKSYGSSIMSQAKRQLIKDIASDIANDLKIKGADPKGKSLDDVIKALKQLVPDPREGRGNGRSYKSDKSHQENTCKTIARIINKRMGTTVVNVNDPPASVCDQVSEVMHALFTGIHGEFVNVRKDVERIMKNLNSLQGMLETNFNALQGRLARIQEEEGSNIGASTSTLRKFHEDLLAELKRQRMLLAGMTDTTTAKHEQDLNELLKENKEFKGLVKKIKAAPGSSKFGEKLSYVLSGVRTVAEAANEVDKALRALGVSREEYAKHKNPKDLKKFIGKRIASKLDTDADDLHNYIKASKALYAHQYMHDDIIKSLKSKSGRGEHSDMESMEGGEHMDMDSVSGGAVHGGLKLDKRVKRREELRRDLLKVFNQQLSSLYGDMTASIKRLTDSVLAKKTDLSDEMENFIRAVEILPDIGKKYTYFALTGYHDDIRSREYRERFIASAKYMLDVVDSMSRKSGTSGLPALGDLKKSLEGLIDLVGKYYKKFAEGFGVMEAGVKGSGIDTAKLKAKGKEIAKEAAKTASEVALGPSDTHGAAEDAAAQGGALGDEEVVFGSKFNMAQINRIAYDFNNSVNKLTYGFRTAKIRQNLAKLPAERKSFSDNYERVVGDAVAAAVDNVNKQLKDFLTQCEPVEAAPANPQDKGYIYSKIRAAANNDANEAKARTKDLVDFAKDLAKSKVELYRTAEALEHYMNAFSDGITENPDGVQDIVQMLNSTEIISKWYSEKSGDAVAAAFEVFPSAFANNVPQYSKANSDNNNTAFQDKHYYERVAAICRLTGQGLPRGAEAADAITGPNVNATLQHPGLPGNPLLAVPVYKEVGGEHRLRDALAYMDNALHVNPLKNIASIFVSIGSQFGGEDLASKSHLTPPQIYKNLLNYVKMSSFALGAKPLENNAAPELGLSTIIPAGVSGTTYNNGTATLAPTDALTNNALNLGNATQGERAYAYAAFAGVGNAAENNMMVDNFKDTDNLFQMCIKSMVSKVLTTIGVYNMFNRSYTEDGLGFYSGLRLVLGGASETPQVIPEALELYIRLPLLAEFYREIFNFDQTDTNNPDYRAISLVPEMSGTFSGLINIIFDRARYVTEGNYGDADTRALVQEINKIYNHFKGSKNPVSDAIDEFIAEVNRRYGIIESSERTRYLNERRDRYKDLYTAPEELEDFELSGLDDDTDFNRPAPSLSYQTEFADSSYGTKHKYDLGNIGTHETMLRKVRMKIDELFDDAKREHEKNNSRSYPDTVRLPPISFASTLRARKQELKAASTNEEKYKVISTAINGFGSFAVSALSHSMTMFHETVVKNLTILKSVAQSIEKFKSTIGTLDELLKKMSSVRTIGDLQTLLGKAKYTNYFYAANVNAVAVGSQGAVADVSVANVEALLTAAERSNIAENVRRANEYLLRFRLQQGEMMVTAFEALYAYTQDHDKLVDLNIEAIRDNDDKLCAINVSVSQSGLIDEVKSLIVQTKAYMDKFRGVLPKSVIDNYERATTDDAPTLYNLEKLLLDQLISGRQEQRDAEEYPIDRVNEKLANLMKYFTRTWNFNARDLETPPDANGVGAWLDTHYSSGNTDRVEELNGANAVKYSRHEFDREMEYLIYYNPFANLSQSLRETGQKFRGSMDIGGNEKIIRPSDFVGLFKLLGNSDSKNKLGVKPNAKWDGVPDAIKTYYSRELEDWDLSYGTKGLWLSFNRLVSTYLKVVYDSSLQRVYAPLVDKFANGGMSSAVFNGKWFDDSAGVQDVNLITNSFFGAYPRAAPKDGVLLRSLAIMLRQLVSEPHASGDRKKYLESDLAEIPLYMKERLAANLPIIRKMLHMLIQRANLAQKFSLGLYVAQPLDYAAVGFPGLPARTNSEMTTNLTKITDAIARGCQSLITCIDETMSDLNDDPKYMQLHTNFIEDYKSANGKMPFMPASSLTYLIRTGANYNPNAENEFNEVIRPLYKPGDDRFKIMYGSRGIVNSDPTLKDLPGMIDILKVHNSSVDGRSEISEKDLNDSLRSSLRLLRYVLNSAKYKAMLSTKDSYTYGLNTVPDNSRTTWQTKDTVSLNRVVLLTESAFQKDQVQSIVTHVQNIENCDDYSSMSRKAIIAYNIVDLNKVPINFAALMKEMPMVNLLNYSYTFDRMIMDMLGLSKDDVDAITKYERENPLSITMDKLRGTGVPNTPGQGMDARNSGQVAARLLGLLTMFPYTEVDQQVYLTQVSRIVRGDAGIQGLDRPSYLGDQIYNKALFGELYPGKFYQEEAGPRTVNARAKPNRGMLESIITNNIAGGITDDQVKAIIDTAVTGASNAKIASVAEANGATNQEALRIANNIVNASTGFDAPGNTTTSMYYMVADKNGRDAEIRDVEVGGYKYMLQAIGRMRFDTKFVRNLFWLTNIQRLLRLKMRQELNWFDSKIVSEHAVLAPSITEYSGNRTGPLNRFME